MASTSSTAPLFTRFVPERGGSRPGAAAVGVGVAAWSAPSIRTLGTTPAYAAVCTVSFTLFTSGDRNVSCDCKPNIDYHFPITPFFANVGGTQVAFTVDDVPHSNKECSNTQVPVTIVGPTSNGQPVWDCQIASVTVATNSGTCIGLPQTVSAGGLFMPVLTLADPACCSNAKWSVTLQCAPHGTCPQVFGP